MRNTHVNFIKDTKDIIAMLKKEVSRQIEMLASHIASEEFMSSEQVQRYNIEKAIAHFENKLKDNPEDENTRATIARLKKELGQKKKPLKNSELSFSKASLRRLLHTIFGAYLAYLEEKDSEGFNQAMAIIEEGISNREKVLTKAKKELGMKLNSRNEEPQKTEKAILKSVRKFIQPVDKVSQEIFKSNENEGFYNTDGIDVIVAGKGTKKEVTSAVSINIENCEGVQISNDVMLNPYNRAVHNAVVSIYEAGNTHATFNQIHKVMNGNRPTLKAPEEETRKAIMKSIEKMMCTKITIDLTNEAKLYNFDRMTIKDVILPVQVVTAEVNGQIVDCVKFRGEPPLDTYAKKKKQVNTCDIKMLDTPLKSSEENTIITNYLLERVQGVMTPHSNLSNVILYDTLYKYLGLEAKTPNALRQRKLEVREKVKKILQYWVSIKFIKGFSDVIEGKTITGVMVYVKKRK